MIWRNYNYVRLDGSVHPIKRSVVVENFERKGSEVFVFLLTTRAGGLGINNNIIKISLK